MVSFLVNYFSFTITADAHLLSFVVVTVPSPVIIPVTAFVALPVTLSLSCCINFSIISWASAAEASSRWRSVSQTIALSEPRPLQLCWSHLSSAAFTAPQTILKRRAPGLPTPPPSPHRPHSTATIHPLPSAYHQQQSSRSHTDCSVIESSLI